MKRLLLIVLVVALLLAVPRGVVTVDEICTDCGKIRRSEHVWVVSKRWDWDFRGSDLAETEVSRFIREIGTPAGIHVWRASRTPLKAGRVMAQERGLVPFDREIAWDAVRARLRNPRWDSTDPGWYVGQGWPPSTLQEAKAWWAGVADRGGSFSH